MPFGCLTAIESFSIPDDASRYDDELLDPNDCRAASIATRSGLLAADTAPLAIVGLFVAVVDGLRSGRIVDWRS